MTLPIQDSRGDRAKAHIDQACGDQERHLPASIRARRLAHPHDGVVTTIRGIESDPTSRVVLMAQFGSVASMDTGVRSTGWSRASVGRRRTPAAWNLMPS